MLEYYLISLILLAFTFSFYTFYISRYLPDNVDILTKDLISHKLQKGPISFLSVNLNFKKAKGMWLPMKTVVF